MPTTLLPPSKSIKTLALQTAFVGSPVTRPILEMADRSTLEGMPKVMASITFT